MELNTQVNYELMEKVIADGDLSKLSSKERLYFYKQTCDSLGLNPLTQPFAYMKLNGKTVLYARKECTEQLRKINGISIYNSKTEIVEDVCMITVNAKDKNGREDVGIGAVTIGGLKGEARANAIMKAETKAKRRATLSISGLGFTDESELDSIPATKINIDHGTGEIIDDSPKAANHIDTTIKFEQICLQMDKASSLSTLKNIYVAGVNMAGDNQVLISKLTDAKNKNKDRLSQGVMYEAV